MSQHWLLIPLVGLIAFIYFRRARYITLLSVGAIFFIVPALFICEMTSQAWAKIKCAKEMFKDEPGYEAFKNKFRWLGNECEGPEK